jgi:DNA-binding MarR family transcriptional regulator
VTARPLIGLTPRQLDVLDAVRYLTRTNGVPPSAQRIGDWLNVTRQAAKLHLDELERMGLVADEPMVIRSGKWRVL